MTAVSGKYGSLRKHQARALAVAREIVAGRRHQKVIVAGVTPGGGKTLMAALFAHELAEAGAIEQVLVVVPNDPLRQQMLENFHDPQRGLDRYLKEATAQGVVPSTGTPFGKVVTYQAVANASNMRRLLKFLSKKKTLVVFDECHHLLEDKAWERGARQIVEAAHLVLCMSGTLWRWDEERIPFVNYDAKNVAVVDIRYSRSEALREQAVLPVEFKFFDGQAVYEHRNVPHNTRLSSAPIKEQSRALKTALKSNDYAEKFLSEAVKDWERYRSYGYPSQLIVACHSQEKAKQAHQFIKHNYAKYFPVLSVSSEATADKAIKQFRAGQASVLTTVKKAYEGLDVKGATHLVYLGDIRSWPFLDQVIARITRHNPNAAISWAEQRGYVYAPDDKHMRDYVDNMLDEQAEYFREKEESLNGVTAKHTRSSFKPEAAEVTEINYGLDGRCLTKEENIGIRRLQEECPELQAPLSFRLKCAERFGFIPQPPGPPQEQYAAAE